MNGLFKNIIHPALILIVICASVAAAIAGTSALTAGEIARQKSDSAQRSQEIVLPLADSFQQEDDHIVGYSDGNIAGYIFMTSASGYGGGISVMTGISADGMITGVTVLSHSETPGLGAKAQDSEFTSQFLQSAQNLEVIRFRPADTGEIEALTGATITSAAVTDAVNEAISAYQDIVGGGSQ